MLELLEMHNNVKYTVIKFELKWSPSSYTDINWLVSQISRERTGDTGDEQKS